MTDHPDPECLDSILQHAADQLSPGFAVPFSSPPPFGNIVADGNSTQPQGTVTTSTESINIHDKNNYGTVEWWLDNSAIANRCTSSHSLAHTNTPEYFDLSSYEQPHFNRVYSTVPNTPCPSAGSQSPGLFQFQQPQLPEFPYYQPDQQWQYQQPKPPHHPHRHQQQYELYQQHQQLNHLLEQYGPMAELTPLTPLQHQPLSQFIETPVPGQTPPTPKPTNKVVTPGDVKSQKKGTKRTATPASFTESTPSSPFIAKRRNILSQAMSMSALGQDEDSIDGGDELGAGNESPLAPQEVALPLMKRPLTAESSAVDLDPVVCFTPDTFDCEDTPVACPGLNSSPLAVPPVLAIITADAAPRVAGARRFFYPQWWDLVSLQSLYAEVSSSLAQNLVADSTRYDYGIWAQLQTLSATDEIDRHELVQFVELERVSIPFALAPTLVANHSPHDSIQAIVPLVLSNPAPNSAAQLLAQYTARNLQPPPATVNNTQLWDSTYRLVAGAVPRAVRTYALHLLLTTGRYTAMQPHTPTSGARTTPATPILADGDIELRAYLYWKLASGDLVGRSGWLEDENEHVALRYCCSLIPIVSLRDRILGTLNGVRVSTATLLYIKTVYREIILSIELWGSPQNITPWNEFMFKHGLHHYLCPHTRSTIEAQMQDRVVHSMMERQLASRQLESRMYDDALLQFDRDEINQLLWYLVLFRNPLQPVPDRPPRLGRTRNATRYGHFTDDGMVTARTNANANANNNNHYNNYNNGYNNYNNSNNSDGGDQIVVVYQLLQQHVMTLPVPAPFERELFSAADMTAPDNHFQREYATMRQTLTGVYTQIVRFVTLQLANNNAFGRACNLNRNGSINNELRAALAITPADVQSAMREVCAAGYLSRSKHAIGMCARKQIDAVRMLMVETVTLEVDGLDELLMTPALAHAVLPPTTVLSVMGVTELMVRCKLERLLEVTRASPDALREHLQLDAAATTTRFVLARAVTVSLRQLLNEPLFTSFGAAWTINAWSWVDGEDDNYMPPTPQPAPARSADVSASSSRVSSPKPRDYLRLDHSRPVLSRETAAFITADEADESIADSGHYSAIDDPEYVPPLPLQPVPGYSGPSLLKGGRRASWNELIPAPSEVSLEGRAYSFPRDEHMVQFEVRDPNELECYVRNWVDSLSGITFDDADSAVDEASTDSSDDNHDDNTVDDTAAASSDDLIESTMAALVALNKKTNTPVPPTPSTPPTPSADNAYDATSSDDDDEPEDADDDSVTSSDVTTDEDECDLLDEGRLMEHNVNLLYARMEFTPFDCWNLGFDPHTAELTRPTENSTVAEIDQLPAPLSEPHPCPPNEEYFEEINAWWGRNQLNSEARRICIGCAQALTYKVLVRSTTEVVSFCSACAHVLKKRLRLQPAYGPCLARQIHSRVGVNPQHPVLRTGDSIVAIDPTMPVYRTQTYPQIIDTAMTALITAELEVERAEQSRARANRKKKRTPPKSQ